MKPSYFILLLFSILLISCKQSKKEEISHLVKEWQGKEILFPESMIFSRYATDTVDYAIPQSNYKVLIYIDSMGCTSCKLQLNKWKELVAYTDSLTKGAVPFLFVFHPKDRKEISYLLKREGVKFPVCIDTDDTLNKLNKFPSDMTFQTFLLDKNNRVTALGNPIHNLAIKELYLKHITGQSSPTNKLIKTEAEANQPEIDFGSFSKSDIKKATFTIKNTGNHPLVIVDVSTTCGCTAATYDKQPAKPGESLQVGIEMTPKDIGFFDETVTVKCNTEQPVKLKIKGQVR